jgi:hypothetical protein
MISRTTLLFIIVSVLLVIGYVFANKVQTEIVEDKVIKLVEHLEINRNKGNKATNYRYMVVCEKETYIVESNIFQGKFNNSDIFYRIQEGKTYRFKVSGIGKSFATDYRNIIEVLP